MNGNAEQSLAEQSLMAALGQLRIACDMHEHAAVFTVEESAQLHDEIAGRHTKNLFLKEIGRASCRERV